MKTALYDLHIAAGGKMVDFAGYQLPINYGSQLEEHHAVRKDAGMFDVSHMVVTDVTGAGSKDFFLYLLANDVNKLSSEGKALYSCMLNAQGGIIDDLIVYWLSGDHYRIVSNAATRDKDLAWMQKVAADFDMALTERPELAMLAVQGPQAVDKALSVLPDTIRAKAEKLGRFFGAEDEEWFVGRTGYTGEDGFEIVTTAENITGLWDGLLAAGVAPCGLGARDTLRLEAGMMLYGSDMTEETSPLESGLSWTLAMKDDREFIGKSALLAQQEAGTNYKMAGLVLEGKGVLRAHQEVVVDGNVMGETTSGGYSPSLDKSIAFARVKKDIPATCEVQIRNRLIPATVGSVVFLKNT